MADVTTAVTVDASYLQTLLGYNARHGSPRMIALFNERLMDNA